MILKNANSKFHSKIDSFLYFDACFSIYIYILSMPSLFLCFGHFDTFKAQAAINLTLTIINGKIHFSFNIALFSLIGDG